MHVARRGVNDFYAYASKRNTYVNFIWSMNDVDVDVQWPDGIDICQVHLHRSSFIDHMKFTFEKAA